MQRAWGVRFRIRKTLWPYNQDDVSGVSDGSNVQLAVKLIAAESSKIWVMRLDSTKRLKTAKEVL